MNWIKLRKSAFPRAKTFLREHEQFCVNAISRFSSEITHHVWAAQTPDPVNGKLISGLLLYGNRLLYPVFHSPDTADLFPAGTMPLPRFFSWILNNNPLHAIQGVSDHVRMVEGALGQKGFLPVSRYDYELRGLECAESGLSVKNIPGLHIRHPTFEDADSLFPLQAGYEQEEVLPKGAVFNPSICRIGLDKLIADNQILMAELEGRIVGKININAQSFTCFQIGGVYVVPQWRNYGIARAMIAALIREFASQKNHFILFVKKANLPARKVYDHLGFGKIADYRICYYE